MKVTAGITGHGFQPGDIVAMSTDGTRWEKLKRLMVRPRVKVVDEITVTTFSLRERRMTWREWRRAVWAAILG